MSDLHGWEFDRPYAPPRDLSEALRTLLRVYTCRLRRHPFDERDSWLRDRQTGRTYRTCACGRRVDPRPVT